MVEQTSTKPKKERKVVWDPDPPPTAEEIARRYSAALDSVNLINSQKPEDMSDEEWNTTIAMNKSHLKIMLQKTFWTTEDLTPLQEAVADLTP